MRLRKNIVEYIKRLDESILEFAGEKGEEYARTKKVLCGLVPSVKTWHKILREATTKRFHITFWNKKNFFLLKRSNSSEFYVCIKDNGLYSTNWKYTQTG